MVVTSDEGELESRQTGVKAHTSGGTTLKRILHPPGRRPPPFPTRQKPDRRTGSGRVNQIKIAANQFTKVLRLRNSGGISLRSPPSAGA